MSSMLKGTGTVAILTLVSRVFGFVRDSVIASVFGAGVLSDAFFVAFRIPNLLRSLVAEGALTSAFVPVFAKEIKSGQEQAQSLLSNVLTLLVYTSLWLSALGIIFTEDLVKLMAPGFNDTPGKLQLCMDLTRIMLPYILFVSVVALLNGALNSCKIYGAAPLAQIAMNLVLALGAFAALLFSRTAGVYVLAWSVIVGGIVQIFIQYPAMRKANLQLKLGRALLTPASKEIIHLMLPATLGAAVYQIAIFFSTLFASLLSNGSVSWLFYADRIGQFPIGIFSVALGSVLLPTLARAVADQDDKAYSFELNNALRYTSFLLIPSAIGMAVIAEPLCSLLFQRGSFSAFDTHMTALALIAQCYGIWGASIGYMLVRAFLALKDTRTPVILSLLQLGLTVLLSIALMGPPDVDLLQHSLFTEIILGIQNSLHLLGLTNDLGHVGLALSSGLASTIIIPISFLLLNRKKPDLSFSIFIRGTCRVLFASLPLLLLLYTPSFITHSILLHLAFATSAGALMFIIMAYLLGIPELQETFRKLRRKIS